MEGYFNCQSKLLRMMTIYNTASDSSLLRLVKRARQWKLDSRIPIRHRQHDICESEPERTHSDLRWEWLVNSAHGKLKHGAQLRPREVQKWFPPTDLANAKGGAWQPTRNSLDVFRSIPTVLTTLQRYLSESFLTFASKLRTILINRPLS